MNKKYDCIIVGFGTAGAIAAISASRMGAKVLVIEKNSYSGGTHTGGLIAWFYDQGPVGIMKEITNMSIENIDLSEGKKHLFEQLALQNNVDINYEATVIDLIMEERVIKSIIWIDKDDEIHTSSSASVIDCTAEGAVARMAKCELFGGRESDGLFQPFTNIMALTATCRVKKTTTVAQANFDAGRINQNSADVLTKIMLESSQTHLYEDYATRRDLMVPSDVIGCREGQHVRTKEVYTLFDLLEKERVVDEVIFYAYSNIDTHSNDLSLESDLFQEWMIGCSLWGAKLVYPIPYKTIIANDVDNLLIAGRHFGVEHDIGHALRMNSCMGALGEVAGITAAIAAKNSTLIAELEYKQILPYLSLDTSMLKNNDKIWNLSEEEIFNGLSSQSNGYALWSAKKHLTIEKLKMWYDAAESESDLKRHLAFALALKRSSYGKEMLYKMVVERDLYTPNNGRKYNHQRGYVAVFFLGLIADDSSVELLGELFNYSGENRYKYHTHAISALIKIGEVHSHLREKIAQYLKIIAEDSSYILESRLKGTVNSMKRMDIYYRINIAKSLRKWGIAENINSAIEKIELDALEFDFWQQQLNER